MDIFCEVKQRCNILDVAERYCRSGPFKRSGKLYRCKSPFKLEKTASCFLYPDTNSFMDYSSGRGGDCIKFVAFLFGISNYEAALKIAADFNIPLPDDKELDKNKVRSIIRQNEELDKTAVYLKYQLELLCDKLCTLFKCFRQIKEMADSEGVEKSSIGYQFVLFHYTFFDRYSELFAKADTEKQIDYTLHITDYYEAEWRCFKEWLMLLISDTYSRTTRSYTNVSNAV